MTRFPAHLYADWRESSPVLAALRESVDPPPERLLQHVWLHQRIVRDSLQTTDGRALRILHPGFWNREAGPDFRQAVLQFGDDRPVSGDVEIDLSPAGWRNHGHHTNPAYTQVILHVVWEARGGLECSVPTLTLQQRLDAPAAELADWAASGETSFPPALAGRCHSPLSELTAEDAAEILLQAAQVRLRHKADALRARARRAGWEQALWEGLFGALGYKHNTWPMRRIAELLPRLASTGGTGSNAALDWQARLLGVGGLLPEDHRGDGATQVRRLWDIWWRERDAVADAVLPRSLWRFGGLRPANHPQRRLALAAHWLAGGDLVDRLEKWFSSAAAEKHPAARLVRILQPPHDPFWSRRWTFRSRAGDGPCPLLGPARVADLAVNVVLPWFHARARAGQRPETTALVERLFLAWPASEDNAVLRQARIRLFGTSRNRARSAAAQQGLLQIVRDFCDHSNAICDDCRFPRLVQSVPTYPDARPGPT